MKIKLLEIEIKILKCIADGIDGGACTTEIYSDLDGELSLYQVNGYMSKLRGYGLVEGKRSAGLMVIKLTDKGRKYLNEL